jgi:multidrug efflux pump subunit AcrB
MHNFWIFFLKKRAFTYLIIAALVIGGSYSLVSIPKESSPEVIIPYGIVTTVLRGGSAEDTEKLITDKLESEVVNLDNIDKVTSQSREGVSIVTAQFNANANIDKSIQDLKDAVDRAKTSFPTEANEPNVSRVNFADQPILIVSVSSDASGMALTKLGDDLKNEIKKVGGVSRVDISGTRKREVGVVVKKQELQKYGLSVDQVVGAIAGANASFPIGNITVSDINYPVKFSGSIDDPAELPDITVSAANGVPVYLRDVAFVADSLADPTTFSRASVAGDPATQALTLSIFKRSGGDVTVITRNVNKKIEDLKSSLLVGANVVVSFDRGALVQKDLKDLIRVGLETVALVILMLVLTIGWRESIVAALSIPLSFVIAFIGLYASGNTINFLSLFSLILAIGILVDSGIVVTEAIHTRLAKYGSAELAAEASIKEYAWPLIAGTMTTVAVFAPLFFLSGIVGKVIASIPFTLIFVLISSLFVALGMVPLIAILFTSEHKNRFEERQDEYSIKVQAWYKKFLGKILGSNKIQNRFLFGMFVAFVLALSLPIIGAVKVLFFPQDNQDFIYVEVEKQQGTPLGVTDLSTREVEEFIYNYPNVSSFVTTVGAGSSFSGTNEGANTKFANITILLSKDRDLTSTEIVDDLREKLSPIKSAKITVSQANNGPPSSAPVSIKFTGDDLNDITTAATAGENLLRNIPGTLDVQNSLKDDSTQFTITIDRAKAAGYGLTSMRVAQTLRTAVSGVTGTTIKNLDNDINVLVKLDLNSNFVNPEDTTKTTVDSIEQIPISTPQGTVLMGSIISVKLDQSRAVINHEGQKRIATVSSGLATGKTALEVTADFRDHASKLNIPKSVTIDYGGESEDVNQTFREMGLALLAGMFLMLAIMVLEFNSFRFTLYLLSIIPLSLIGVFVGLAVSRQALSFSSMLGVIALAGVIINHAIILLDSILHMLRADMTGKTLKDVVIEASAVRLRPIFLTTITTVIGMVPLAGASALWGPLAYAIMFGLSFAMVLTLILIPLLFYRWPGREFKKIKRS